MPQFKVVSPIKFQGKRFEPEALVTLPEATAVPLLAAGVIEPSETLNEKAVAEGKSGRAQRN